MLEFVFSAGVGGSVMEGPVAGEKRARTQEMMDVGGLDSDDPSPPLPPISMSFKDKVSGDFGMAEDQLVIGDDDFVIEQGEIPLIQFSDKVKSCLFRPWRTTVILKLMGRPLSYAFLRTRLLQKWDLKGPISLIDLENNYFIAKFLLAEDMRYVLSGGPWQIVGQYVVTQQWKPGFNAKEEKITHMTAWVRINGLNMEYFRSDVMEKIGNLIGTTVKVDAHTMSQARGKFARVCVELDLAKPLTPFIKVEGRSYGVVYEGIQLVCFECGCYGHGRDSCPVILQAKKQESNSGHAENMEVNTSAKSGGLSVNNPVTKDAEVPAKMHGQWMLMKPRSFNKKKVVSESRKVPELGKFNSKESGSKDADILSGSRFNVLVEEDSGKNDMEGFTPVSTRRNVRSATPPGANLLSKAKSFGKQPSHPRESSPWVFKKPLKDITNASSSNVGGVVVKGVARSLHSHPKWVFWYVIVVSVSKFSTLVLVSSNINQSLHCQPTILHSHAIFVHYH
ncbi:unnamed protein product [Prunus armeniaca]